MLKILSVLFVAAFLLLPYDVFGCRCATESVEEKLKESSAVFSGTVLRIRKIRYNTLKVTLAVDRCWKGYCPTNITVITDEQTSSCGAGFWTGESYLIYASRHDRRYLGAYLCGVEDLEDAGLDLKVLGKGKAPLRTTRKSRLLAIP